MPVTEGQVRAALVATFTPGRPNLFKPRTLANGDFTAAEDDNAAVSADVKTAQAEFEVGADTPAADAVAMVLGQPIRDSFISGQTTDLRPTLDLETGADGEAVTSTEVGFGAHKDPNLAEDNLMSLDDHDLYDGTASGKLLSMEGPVPGVILDPVIREREFLVLVTRSPSSQTLELANHILSIPVMVWDGRGL